MNLAEKYKEEGRARGMCDKVYSEISADTTKDELVAKWVENIDFAIQSGFPTAQQIKEDFRDVIHDHNVFVDEKVYGKDKSNVVLNGACEATLIYTDSCWRAYARHASKVHVRATGKSRIFISVHDDAEIDVFTGCFAKVFVYRYDNAKVKIISGNVMVRDRKNT